jgi:hypothetical protein
MLTLLEIAMEPEVGDDIELTGKVIRLVDAICREENVELSLTRLAELVSVVYLDAAENGRPPDREYVRQVVRLFSPLTNDRS